MQGLVEDWSTQPLQCSTWPAGYWTTRKNWFCAVMATVCGFCVPKVVQVGFPERDPVVWRLKPGPLLHEMITLLPLRTMLIIGGIGGGISGW